MQGTPSLQQDPLAQVTCRAGDASCAGAHASTLNRATDSQPAHAGQSLRQLQRQYGNRYVQRVLAQARNGERGGAASPDVEQAIQQARGGGQALDSGVRTQMEPAFGADFGDVRVHADAQSDALNRSLNARAFTTGQDIFFRQGAYSPGSSSGRELLAHELTHVVQQNGNRVQRKLTIGQPGDRYEQEADRVARAVLQQEQQPIRKDTDKELVQRQVEEDEEEESLQAKMEDAWVQRQVEEEEEVELAQAVMQREQWAVQRQVETGTIPASTVQRAVADDYGTIRSNLSYGLFDWAIRDYEARQVLRILEDLSDQDLIDTYFEMATDGLWSRFTNNVPSNEQSALSALQERIDRLTTITQLTPTDEAFIRDICLFFFPDNPPSNINSEVAEIALQMVVEAKDKCSRLMDIIPRPPARPSLFWLLRQVGGPLWRGISRQGRIYVNCRNVVARNFRSAYEIAQFSSSGTPRGIR